jgi:hypothetical protein
VIILVLYIETENGRLNKQINLTKELLVNFSNERAAQSAWSVDKKYFKLLKNRILFYISVVCGTCRYNTLLSSGVTSYR